VPPRKESVTHIRSYPEDQAHCAQDHEGMQQKPNELSQRK